MARVPPKPDNSTNHHQQQQHRKQIAKTATAGASSFFQNRHAVNLTGTPSQPKFDFASEPQQRIANQLRRIFVTNEAGIDDEVIVYRVVDVGVEIRF